VTKLIPDCVLDVYEVMEELKELYPTASELKLYSTIPALVNLYLYTPINELDRELKFRRFNTTSDDTLKEKLGIIFQKLMFKIKTIANDMSSDEIRQFLVIGYITTPVMRVIISDTRASLYTKAQPIFLF